MLVELMVFISAISFFLLSFYFFETHSARITKKIKLQQNRLAEIKDSYYFAMTTEVAELMTLPAYSVEELDESHYKVFVVSDDVFSDLFVIRKK